MIVYFASRDWKINLVASSTTRDGAQIFEDLLSEDLETGTASFTGSILYNEKNYFDVRRSVKVGNYVLFKQGDVTRGFTITNTEDDRKDMSIHFDSEDAGLELLNEVAIKYPDNLSSTPPMTLTQFINMWIAYTGFVIGRNDAASDTTTKDPQAPNDADGVRAAMDNETTITDRIIKTAQLFGYEIGYSFDIDTGKNLVTSKYVDIYKKRGKDTGIRYSMNKEIDTIRITENINNVATSLLCYGGNDGSNPVTLDGHTYDDGDFVIANQYFADRKATHACLQSRVALNNWGRIVNGSKHHLTAVFNDSNALTWQSLLNSAKEELKKKRESEKTYQIDVSFVDDDINLGDYIQIVDTAARLFIKVRVLKIEKSESDAKINLTLGDETLLA